MFTARCRMLPCRNMYVKNVHGLTHAYRGENPNVARNHGLTKIVICSRNTMRLATISRHTHGVMPRIRWGPIRPQCVCVDTAVRLSVYPPTRLAVSRQPADPLAQLWELDPRGARGLGEEARPCHARQRVRLEAKDVALGAQSEVDPRVAAEFQRPVRGERQLLELPREPGVELGREHLVRHPRRVLALVVEQFVLRHDLADGQRHVAQDTHGELAPRDEL